jgi:hypothetical protein
MNLAARNQSILSSTAILGAIVLVVVIGFGIGYVYMGGSPRFSRVEWLRRGGHAFITVSSTFIPTSANEIVGERQSSSESNLDDANNLVATNAATDVHIGGCLLQPPVLSYTSVRWMISG